MIDIIIVVVIDIIIVIIFFLGWTKLFMGNTL